MTKLEPAPWLEGEEPARGGRYDTAGNLLKPRNLAEFARLNDAEKDEAERQGWVSYVPAPSPRRSILAPEPWSILDAP